MSVTEASDAVLMIANRMFGGNRKNCSDNKPSFDVDALPSTSRIRNYLQLKEAKPLSLVADKAQKILTYGRMMTNAIDLTTKKRVGQFAMGEIHLGQNLFPLLI